MVIQRVDLVMVDLIDIFIMVTDLKKGVRRGRAADGRTQVQLRKVPPPRERWVAKSGLARARARAQKRHSLDRG